jgi:hypothetical protein
VRVASGDIVMEDEVIESREVVEIPLTLNNSDNILSFEGKIVFNSQHLTFNKIIWHDLKTKFMIDVESEGDEILIAGASTSSSQKIDGIFATLQFTVNENFNDSQTAVTLKRLRWNESMVMENVATATLALATNVAENGTEIPQQYSLSQNYPNPFNPTTTIRYSLKELGPVKIQIYNQVGHLVTTLVHKTQSAGTYSVVWDGKNEMGEKVASGFYLYTLKAGENTLITRTMIMIK